MNEFQDLYDELSAPFPYESVEWRVGSTNQDKSKGMALCYVDARAVMDRLDRVVGFEAWQDRYSHADRKTICELGIKIDGEWIWKADGAGDTDFEADKGALSDSFKRAAVRWGVGRYLYDLPAPWVEIQAAGRSFKITDAAKKGLEEAYHKVCQRTIWGDRNHQNLYRTLLATVHQFVAADQVDKFIDENKGQLSQLPAQLKRQLWQELERIKDGYQAVAAE